jgi:hypothetical protein
MRFSSDSIAQCRPWATLTYFFAAALRRPATVLRAPAWYERWFESFDHAPVSCADVVSLDNSQFP